MHRSHLSVGLALGYRWRICCHSLVLVALLLGLIPPPLLRSVLPPAEAALVEALLPTIPTAQAAAVTLAIATGSDDAAQTLPTNAVFTNLTPLNLANSTVPTVQQIGLRFANVTIPQGSTINSAYVQFTASGSDSTTTINLLVRGQAADNAATFTTATNNIGSRPVTSASVAWSNVPAWIAAGDAGAAQQTPSLVNIIQEIVNRSGWVSGNALALIISDNGTTANNIRRRVTSFEGNPANAPRLVLDFTPPGALVVNKQVATSDGSNPTVSGPFTINLNCGGANIMPSSSQTVTAGGSVTFRNIPAGTACIVSENTTNLPAAPNGYTWAAHQLTPNPVSISSGLTTTVTARNTLMPQVTPNNVLTVTKTVAGPGSGLFTVTVTGPNGYNNSTTINPGTPLVLTGLAQGVYTVTEASPGAGWTTTYTATASTGSATGGSSNAVVNLTQASAVAPFTTAAITGTVYRDSNSDGQLSTTGTVTDTGVAGVTVTAYNTAGVAVGVATTGANGGFTLPLSAPNNVGPFRLEFSNLPAGYEPGRVFTGTQNGASVQFINSAAQSSGVYFAINTLSETCSSYYLGTSSSCLTNSTGILTATLPVFYLWPYERGGLTGATGQSPPLPGPLVLARANQIGNTWGQAVQPSSQSIFLAAWVRRDGGMPAGGSTGSIYRLAAGSDRAWGTGDDVLERFVDLNTLFGSNVAGVVNWAINGGGDAVGSNGLGDLDIAADGSRLYVMNMTDRRVYQIPLGANPLSPTPPTSSSQIVVSPPIPAPTGQCNVSPFTRWVLGLGVRNGLIYAAQTCASARNVPGFGARTVHSIMVYTLDPVSNTWGTAPVLDGWMNSFTRSTFDWHVPSDIVFDGADMVISTRSLAEDKAGSKYPPGDIVRACATGVNSWVLESAATCGGRTSLGTAQPVGQGFPLTVTTSFPNDLVPAPTAAYEYYWNDTAPGEDTTTLESVKGGLALIPGTGEVAVITFDVFGTYESGVSHFDNSTGALRRAYMFYKTPIGPPRAGQPVNAKVAPLGDLEYLCDAPPLEIGNRVWHDLDTDGVQDAGEPGISGITVSRQGPTNTVTTVTDSNGHYYFGDLRPYIPYTLTMSSPAGYSLTQANAIARSGASASSNHAISDTLDSDAMLVGGLATIYYTTGVAGQNNHGLDFGFIQPVMGTVGITNTPPESLDLALIKDANVLTTTPGVAFRYTLTVINRANTVTATNVTVDDPLPAGVFFQSATPSGGTGGVCTYTAGTRTVTCTWATLPPGQQATVIIEVVP